MPQFSVFCGEVWARILTVIIVRIVRIAFF